MQTFPPTRPHPAAIAAAIGVSAAIVLLACAPAAYAASGESLGANLGALLTTWAKSLFSGVVALISIVFLVNRRYNDLALFIAAAVLVGGLIFAAPTVASVIRGIWTTIGAA